MSKQTEINTQINDLTYYVDHLKKSLADFTDSLISTIEEFEDGLAYVDCQISKLKKGKKNGHS